MLKIKEGKLEELVIALADEIHNQREWHEEGSGWNWWMKIKSEFLDVI